MAVSVISPVALFWNSSATMRVSFPASRRMSQELMVFGEAPSTARFISMVKVVE